MRPELLRWVTSKYMDRIGFVTRFLFIAPGLLSEYGILLMSRICAIYNVYNEDYWLPYSVASIYFRS